jgi:hypothetical protein
MDRLLRGLSWMCSCLTALMLAVAVFLAPADFVRADEPDPNLIGCRFSYPACDLTCPILPECGKDYFGPGKADYTCQCFF